MNFRLERPTMHRRRTFLLPTLVLFGFLAGACGDGADPPSSPNPPDPDPEPTPQVAHELAFVTHPGDIPLGVDFGEPLSVEVRDESGERVSDAAVVVELTLEGGSPEGSIVGTSSATAISGVATFRNLTVDRSGTYVIRASGGDLLDAVSGEFTVDYSFRSVDSRGHHACARTTGDLVLCWGMNYRGQAGLSTNGADVPRPSEIASTIQFDTIVPGGFSTCGLSAGTAYCWGQADDGQLGDGDKFAHTPLPQLVSGGHVFSAISTGHAHVCGVTTSGDVYCWGRGQAGLAGDGSTGDADEPVLLQGGISFASVDAGAAFSCGITDTGAGYCWGASGRLGDGTSESSASPRPVDGGHTFRMISAGVRHACALDTSDKAWCWGDNGAQQLGDGTDAQVALSPVKVLGDISFRSIRAGLYHSCAVDFNDVAYCWGSNQLPRGPQPVEGGVRFQQLVASYSYSCGLTVEGSITCWGANGRHQLGRGFASLQEIEPGEVAEPALR